MNPVPVNIGSVQTFPGTRALVGSLRSLKILGSDIRIRPGRATELLAAFSSVDKSILGDCSLELNDFPVSIDKAGKVAQVTSFKSPLLWKGYRTTIKYRKDSLFSPWVELDRTTKEIDTDSCRGAGGGTWRSARRKPDHQGRQQNCSGGNAREWHETTQKGFLTPKVGSGRRPTAERAIRVERSPNRCPQRKRDDWLNNTRDEPAAAGQVTRSLSG